MLVGGNSKCLMFCQVSPSASNHNETSCSLKFAARVRNVELGQAKRSVKSGDNVKTKAELIRQKEESRSKDDEIESLRDTCDQLRDQLSSAESTIRELKQSQATAVVVATRSAADEVTISSLQQQNAQLQAQLASLKAAASTSVPLSRVAVSTAPKIAAVPVPVPVPSPISSTNGAASDDEEFRPFTAPAAGRVALAPLPSSGATPRSILRNSTSSKKELEMDVGPSRLQHLFDREADNIRVGENAPATRTNKQAVPTVSPPNGKKRKPMSSPLASKQLRPNNDDDADESATDLNQSLDEFDLRKRVKSGNDAAKQREEAARAAAALISGPLTASLAAVPSFSMGKKLFAPRAAATATGTTATTSNKGGKVTPATPQSGIHQRPRTPPGSVSSAEIEAGKRKSVRWGSVQARVISPPIDANTATPTQAGTGSLSAVSSSLSSSAGNDGAARRTAKPKVKSTTGSALGPAKRNQRPATASSVSASNTSKWNRTTK
jgi:hypothetical protein